MIAVREKVERLAVSRAFVSTLRHGHLLEACPHKGLEK